jgi:hypothetical protein
MSSDYGRAWPLTADGRLEVGERDGGLSRDARTGHTYLSSKLCVESKAVRVYVCKMMAQAEGRTACGGKRARPKRHANNHTYAHEMHATYMHTYIDTQAASPRV